jgi:DNA-binding response OmpR family regulator
MRILIVEQEKLLSRGIHKFLRKEGFYCKEVYTGKEALEMILVQKFDLLLIDLKLPDLEGLEVMKRAHALRNNLPVIIISEKTSPEDRIQGLNMGADDYLSQPFSFLEMKSRILAIIRRKNNLTENAISLENIQIDLDTRRVSCNQQPLRLTRKEYDILVYLILNKNRVISRLQLSENVWGDSLEEDYNSNFIDVHIKNLRKKLAPFLSDDFLETIRGIGFRINQLQPG